MSYKNQFYLEAELDEDELTEDEDIEKELDKDDDDNYDDENGYDADNDDDDDELENDESDDDESDEEDEPRPMRYDDLDDFDDDTSEEGESEDDDGYEFGSDDSDIQNDYDSKDVETLNKLISSEASAVQEYLDADKVTSQDILHRLYADIANEERFHIEQLMYAKAKLTGEKYEPADPEVKREYEELREAGMDEDSAMSTACDKCSIAHDREYTNDSIEEIIDDINDFTESFVESVANNLMLSSLGNVQEVYIEYADIIGEAVQNSSDRNIQNDNEVHPIKFIISIFTGILKFIRSMVKRIKEFLRKIHIKDMNKIRWIRKHGIKGLFKDGVWLYMWSDEGDHRGGLYAVIKYADLFSRIALTIENSMNEKKEAPAIQQPRIRIMNSLNLRPIRYRNVKDGVDIIRNVVFSKEKIIVTDSNEEMLEKLFFGISNDGTGRASNNIYNWMDVVSQILEVIGQDTERLLTRLRELEGDYSSSYAKNPALYNRLVSSTKALTKEFSKFSKVISHDMTTVMNLNSGLYELMKEYDDTKQYNRGSNEEAQEDIKNGKFAPRRTSDDLKQYYGNLNTNVNP